MWAPMLGKAFCKDRVGSAQVRMYVWVLLLRKRDNIVNLPTREELSLGCSCQVTVF